MRSREVAITPKDIRRFWSKVDLTPNKRGCLLWTAGLDAGGYGAFCFNGEAIHAHRMVWLIVAGSLPTRADGLGILHKCDVRRCVNPDHLYVGTPMDNSRDCVMRGRAKKRGRRGESHHNAKLTRGDVEIIISLRGIVSQKSLGRQFGVSQGAISKIHNSTAWEKPEHLPVESAQPASRARTGGVGEFNGHAKLHEDNVVIIRARAESGEPQSLIASDYGLDQSAVSLIVHHKTWKHVTRRVSICRT